MTVHRLTHGRRLDCHIWSFANQIKTVYILTPQVTDSRPPWSASLSIRVVVLETGSLLQRCPMLYSRTEALPTVKCHRPRVITDIMTTGRPPRSHYMIDSVEDIQRFAGVISFICFAISCINFLHVDKTFISI